MSCWTLLQAPGEAVLVPAGAPHQVLPQRMPVGALQRAQSIRSSPQAVTPSVPPAELGRTESHASTGGKRRILWS